MDYFPVQNKDYMRLIDLFTKDLEKELGVVREAFSIRNMWADPQPVHSILANIDEFKHDVRMTTAILTSITDSQGCHKYLPLQLLPQL